MLGVYKAHTVTVKTKRMYSGKSLKSEEQR